MRRPDSAGLDGHTLFVTRNIDPAAFTTDPQIAFTTIDHLAALLADGTEPKAGWNQSPARP
ncbi:hypothetical protein F3K40_31775 [Streptomyces sp. LBUM 1478]|nr:hypothetical protein [Streptomyces sp. LBUM 1478]